MPEMNPVHKVTIRAGTNLESGTPNTGQFLHSCGSQRQYSKLSGVVGPDNNIWVGGGRLNFAQMIPGAGPTHSGLPIIFYDSAVAVSGGPLSASGHKVLGVLRTSLANSLSGLAGQDETRVFHTVFTSGLCATTASGQYGYCVSFTPVISG